MSSRPQSQRDPNAQEPDDETRRFIEQLAMLMAGFGMQRMAARVFAAVLTSQNGVMTASELAGMLQVSPAAVSGAVRTLVPLGMLRREREPGKRTDHYVISDHMFFEVISSKDSIYDLMADSMEVGVNAVGPSTRAGERMAEMRDFFRYIAKELPLLVERWQKERGAG